jgi:tRNA uridine 5-carbamoylmethylation protein Kti12
MTDGRLVILSGPSCVGKSPLAKALAKFYPELRKRLGKLKGKLRTTALKAVGSFPSKDGSRAI